MYYKINNGSVAFGDNVVLEQINFEIKDKEKIAIVGRNGCGKTTLLRAITGEVELEEGTGDGDFSISKSQNLKIGYLQQIVFKDTSISLLEEIEKSFSHLLEIEKKLGVLLNDMNTSSDENLISKYSTLRDEFEMLGGYYYKKEYNALLSNFGFSQSDLQKKLCEFSGGQKTKIALIKLLLSKPDILLLDEPTNHLDVKAVEWLEDYLKNYPSAIVLVSHDRMLLNNVTNKVYEIEYGETHKYSGNYSDFERQKRLNYENTLKNHELQKKEIDRIQKLIDRFRYKATKARMVQSKIKMLERLQIINPPNRYDLKTFHMNFQPTTNSFKDVLKVKNLQIGYNTPLASVNLSLQAGARLGIVGENGTGKSTLLKTLVGAIKSLGGSFKFGENVKIGYFDQLMAESTSSLTILEDYQESYPNLNQTELRNNLGAFMFSGDDVKKTISTLSGGEKVRLWLCKILGKKPNVLILDEPTNHLDIVSKETLENMLTNYLGTIIFVSHDRYFVNKIATQLLIFDANGVSFFNGTYAEYKEKQKGVTETTKTAIAPHATNENTESKKNTKYVSPAKELEKKKKKLEKIEIEINKIYEELSVLTEKTFDKEIYGDYKKYNEIEENIKTLKQSAALLEQSWENLAKQIDECAVD